MVWGATTSAIRYLTRAKLPFELSVETKTGRSIGLPKRSPQARNNIIRSVITVYGYNEERENRKGKTLPLTEEKIRELLKRRVDAIQKKHGTRVEASLSEEPMLCGSLSQYTRYRLTIEKSKRSRSLLLKAFSQTHP